MAASPLAFSRRPSVDSPPANNPPSTAALPLPNPKPALRCRPVRTLSTIASPPALGRPPSVGALRRRPPSTALAALVDSPSAVELQSSTAASPPRPTPALRGQTVCRRSSVAGAFAPLAALLRRPSVDRSSTAAPPPRQTPALRRQTICRRSSVAGAFVCRRPALLPAAGPP